MNKENAWQNNRGFYDEYIADMIHTGFPKYEDRIAVGIAGEGSDSFGYDDVISRDHDFGTGVCLWLTDEDMYEIGNLLSIKYNEIVDSKERSFCTDRLRERRGVMTIHDFYSNILRIDCNINSCTLTDDEWRKLDHTCLATAVNGEVFRDDLGIFSNYRRMLLDYYPDNIWREMIAMAMHEFSAALQVNYARCMTRGDIVAANLCKAKGLDAAMKLTFLLKRVYPPYYKWTYRALTEIDEDDVIASRLKELAETEITSEAWVGTKYQPNRLNLKDKVVTMTETVATELSDMLKQAGFINCINPYLEADVCKVLK